MRILFASLFLVASALAEEPTPSAEPAPASQCYAATCQHVAKPGEAARLSARCAPGYVSDAVSMRSSDGRGIIFCLCCPVVVPVRPK